VRYAISPRTFYPATAGVEVIILLAGEYLRPGKSPGRTWYFGDMYNILEISYSDY
jgi:hypothetical protein